MRCRILLPFGTALMLLAVALCTGSPLFFMLSLMLFLLILLCLAGVLLAAHTLTLTADISGQSVYRGDVVRLNIIVHHLGLIPIAPLKLELTEGPGAANKMISLPVRAGKRQVLRLPWHAHHIGLYTPGIKSCIIEDPLGFFTLTKKLENTDFRLLVLPLLFKSEPLELAPGDPGSDIMSRATEDLNAPSDVRSYQSGDAMKKIHWKLSLRKGELMVRKFDEPILQEVLILMDCSRPPHWGHPEAEADLRDALLETAGSLFKDQSQTDHIVRLPLHGKRPMDLEPGMGLPRVIDQLARVDFSETDRFERVLTLESRRLRKVGCVAIISARLSSSMVDVMTRMRRMGPNLHLFLVTFAPDDVNLLRLVGKLQQCGIKVSYVTPEMR